MRGVRIQASCPLRTRSYTCFVETPPKSWAATPGLTINGVVSRWSVVTLRLASALAGLPPAAVKFPYAGNF
jgi:hypothetical protein